MIMAFKAIDIFEKEDWGVYFDLQIKKRINSFSNLKYIDLLITCAC